MYVCIDSDRLSFPFSIPFHNCLYTVNSKELFCPLHKRSFFDPRTTLLKGRFSPSNDYTSKG